MYNTIFIYSLYLIFILIIINFLSFVKWWMYRKLLYNNYVNLSLLLEEVKNEAYTKIFQEDLIVHFTSSYITNQDDMKVLQKKFVNIIVSSLGPNIMKDLRTLYGSDDAIFTFLISYFNNRATTDESDMLNEKINPNEEYIKMTPSKAEMMGKN
jgi:hypothetical protein